MNEVVTAGPENTGQLPDGFAVPEQRAIGNQQFVSMARDRDRTAIF